MSGRFTGPSGVCVILLSWLASLALLATGARAEGAAPAERAVKAPLAPRSLLLDVASRGGRLVAVGERGHILVSGDAGRSWVQAEVPNRALLTGVYLHDGKLGWVVGHDEVVLRTRDGGGTWERVHHAPENEKPLLDVWFADARRGLAIGAYGGLLATEDGGDTWQRSSVNGEDDFHLNQIVAASLDRPSGERGGDLGPVIDEHDHAHV